MTMAATLQIFTRALQTPDLSFRTLGDARAVTDACRRLNIVAADVNELSPHYDPSGISTAAACKIVREMLIALGG